MRAKLHHWVGIVQYCILEVAWQSIFRDQEEQDGEYIQLHLLGVEEIQDLDA